MAEPTQLISVELVSIVGSAVGASAWLTWFVANQFNKSRREFYRIISTHNKEDDDRFAAIQDTLNDIRTRNAMKDDKIPPARKSMPRRRYLGEV